MSATVTDRDGFLQNLRLSKLLSKEQLRQAQERVRNAQDAEEAATILTRGKFITAFQAKMLLRGRNSGYFLGPYRVLDQLGQGGMGRVYKAIHETMNRIVALKVLSPQVVDSDRARELFLHEVQAAARLNHPNIVIAFDYNEIEGRHYFAMEYVDGPNLDRYVKDRGPLPIGLACEIVFQAANGLQHAHSKAMVHRDIKPANLLLQHDNDSPTVQVKILDFGLARLGAPKKSEGRRDRVMGTPDYLSPEQSRDMSLVDIRSDLYSLGCTFYFLLTGEVPFPGGGILQKLARHNDEIARPVEELRSDVPPKVAAIVRRLMEKDPDARFQTPDDLMDALAPYAAPAGMDWPIAAPASFTPSPGRSGEEQLLLTQAAEDTEPKALASTEITDEESILEWADAQSKERRFMRRLMLAALAGGALLLTLGAAAGAAAWWWMGQ